MSNLLTRKLEAFGQLPEADRRLLDGALENVRSVWAHEDLIRDGETPGDVHLILAGFACRYKILNGGQRHIDASAHPLATTGPRRALSSR
jgi:CRP-like cAMP-binding protein